METPAWRSLSPAVVKRLRGALDGPGDPPPEIAPLVFETYPEATASAEEHGSQLQLSSMLRSRAFRVVEQHVLTQVFFSWSTSSFAFASWSGLFAVGELGFARISQRPAALPALLALEGALPDRIDPYRVDDLARGLAPLLQAAYGESHSPDSFDREDRDLHMRSGLLDAHGLSNIDEGASFRSFDPVERREWAALRPSLHGVEGQPTDDGFALRYCCAHAVGGGRVRLESVRAVITRPTYAIDVAVTEIGTIRMTAPVWPVIGRPLHIVPAAPPAQAQVVERADWRGRYGAGAIERTRPSSYRKS